MAEKNDNLVLKAALEYHKRGWSIIPISFGGVPPKGFKWGPCQSKRKTESELCELFGTGKYRSLAVVCGTVSGNLVVLDLDSEERCQWWRTEHADLAGSVPTAKTKRGLHIFFRAEPFRKRNGNDVDLLCEGAYVILPPSPNKKWLIPLDGELPLLDPFEWGLEQFDITKPDEQPTVTEDTEDKEDSEDSDETERHRSHKGVSGLLENLENETKQEIETAIASTLPEKQGQRNTAIFPLCRWLRGIPVLRDLPARELKPIVQEWHKRAYPVIGTKPFSTTWADFVHGWKRVKWPKGDVILSHAVKRVLEGKTILPDADEYDLEEARFLLKVCFELQQGMRDKPFFLASRTAGGLVNLSHKAAYKLLEMFVADGKLEIVQRHTTEHAPRYRYVGVKKS